MRPSQVMMTAIMSSCPSVCCVDLQQIGPLWCNSSIYALTTCVVGAIPLLIEFDEGERKRSIVAAVTCLEQGSNS